MEIETKNPPQEDLNSNMGLSVLFFNLAVQCFDVVAWPLFALGYPIWATIQAIETNSISEIRKLITYWVSLSLILIFEELLKLPEWIPFWHFLKLILVGCLVASYFDGSVYVYKHIIHPCLSEDRQVVINMFIKLKQLFLDLLVVSERDVIKEHEPEALENLIAFKPCSETREVAKNDISAVEIKEKKETASAKKIGKIQPDLAPAIDIVRATLEIKDLTASMALCKVVTPPCRSISKEVFISHLQEQRREAASKNLKAKNQKLQSENSSSSAAPKEMATAVLAGSDVPNKQMECTCGTCQITTSSDSELISQLQGQRHNACDKLKDKKTVRKIRKKSKQKAELCTDRTVPKDVPNKQMECTCGTCQITISSDAERISQLQGQGHNACDKLKGKKTIRKIRKKSKQKAELCGDSTALKDF